MLSSSKSKTNKISIQKLGNEFENLKTQDLQDFLEPNRRSMF